MTISFAPQGYKSSEIYSSTPLPESGNPDLQHDRFYGC